MKSKSRDAVKSSQSNPFLHSNIGHWSIDDVGLPTFKYTGKIPYKYNAPDGEKITYPKDPWFLLGNYGITSFVHTSGVFDLYTLRRAWGRLNVATKKTPASQSSIKIDTKEHKLSGLDSPIACAAKKEFGTGFANFKMQIIKGISCERTIATAPSKKVNTGISAILVTVTLKNTSDITKEIAYSEAVLANYQMVDENRISYSAKPKVDEKFGSVSFETHTDKTISKVSKEEASTYDFYPPTLFIKGSTDAIYDYKGKTLAAHHQFKLKAGGSKTLRFVVGFTYDKESIDNISNALFNKGKDDAKFREAWKNKLPDFSYQKDEVIKREQYWNTYVLEASAKYNDYFEETFIPQGMTYDYIWGLNAVARDHLHYSLPTKPVVHLNNANF